MGIYGKSNVIVQICVTYFHSSSRLARRGGVKRISAGIYDETRVALRMQLEKILHDVVAIVGMT